MGIGVTVHAMGDGAARLMLDAMEETYRRNGLLKARHQLGHASSIHPDDLPRLVELDLTPEFSPVLWNVNRMIDGVAGNAGEERMSRRIATRIVQRRPLHTTQELASTVISAMPGNPKKRWRIPAFLHSILHLNLYP